MEFPGKESIWGALGAFVGALTVKALGRVWDRTDANEAARLNYELTNLGKMVDRIDSLEKALDAERKRCDEDREVAREKYLDLAVKYERLSGQFEQLRQSLSRGDKPPVGLSS